MAITIEGVRIKNITITKDENGVPKLNGSYELMSSSGIVLAKQGFNEYSSDIKVGNSLETTKLLHELFSSITDDIHNMIGITK